MNLKLGCFSQLNGFQLAFPAFPVFDILTSNNTIPDKFLGNPLYNTSIWYNKLSYKTEFTTKIKRGFDFLKDLVLNNKRID